APFTCRRGLALRPCLPIPGPWPYGCPQTSKRRPRRPSTSRPRTSPGWSTIPLTRCSSAGLRGTSALPAATVGGLPGTRLGRRLSRRLGRRGGLGGRLLRRLAVLGLGRRLLRGLLGGLLRRPVSLTLARRVGEPGGGLRLRLVHGVLVHL